MMLVPNISFTRCKLTSLNLSYLLSKNDIFKYFLDYYDVNEVVLLQYSITHYDVLIEDINTIKSLLKKKETNINLYQIKNRCGHFDFRYCYNYWK